MIQKKEAQKVGSVKLEPLKSRIFDMQPAQMGGKGHIFTRTRNYQSFVIVAVITFLFFIGLHAFVQGKMIFQTSEQLAFSGYEDFKEGMARLLDFNPQGALKSFEGASETFTALEASTNFLTQHANRFADQDLYLGTANTLLSMAFQVTEIGKNLAHLVESSRSFTQELFSSSPEKIMELTHEKDEQFGRLISQGAEIQQKLARLNVSVLPEELQSNIKEAQEQIATFLSALLDIRTDLQSILVLMGDKIPHRYLILFQNNHEIRATGGFIGSYMIMDINDGKITKMEAKDIYESDGQMMEMVKAPPGIDQLGKYLYMRDANYSPDFPTSAQSLMWFLEASKGPSVDTVLAIDQTLVEEILRLTGPMTSEDLPFELTADNFNRVISFYTEAKLSDTNTPKQLLFNLIPKLKEKLTHIEDIPAVLTLTKKMIKEGHLQMYSNHDSAQQLAKKYRLAGKIIEPSEKTDYLSVVSTSIGGNKTDEFIKSDINHTTTVDEKGRLINDLIIKKTHTYTSENRAEIDKLLSIYGPGKSTPEVLHNILGDGKNLDYMRIYVPLGSELEAITGVEIENVQETEELGYTVFGFTFPGVSPGEDKSIRLRYQLPYKLGLFPGDNYRFIAQKQAGAENLHLIKHFRVDKSLTIKKSYPEPATTSIYSPAIDEAFDGIRLFISAVAKE